eukprot:422101_1
MSITVCLKTPTNEIISLTVDTNDKLILLKQKIEYHIGISCELQQIAFNGKLITQDWGYGDNDFTLSHYNIQNGSTLYLVSRLRNTIRPNYITKHNIHSNTLFLSLTYLLWNNAYINHNWIKPNHPQFIELFWDDECTLKINPFNTLRLQIEETKQKKK